MIRSRATCSLRVHSPPAEFLARVRDLLARRGWEVEDEGQTLVAREDPTRLCCVESPATVTMRLSSDVLEIQAAVPGWGPVSTRTARSRLEAVARSAREASI